MFDLGMQELIVIFVVALLVFGPQKLPELARSLGKGVAELKKALQGVKEQIDSEVEEIKAPLNEEIKDITKDLPRFDYKEYLKESGEKFAGEFLNADAPTKNSATELKDSGDTSVKEKESSSEEGKQKTDE